MLIVGLFTIAKMWKTPKFPLQKNGKRKVVYTYNGILFSHKNEDILKHTEINFKKNMLSGKSQTEQENTS